MAGPEATSAVAVATPVGGAAISAEAEATSVAAAPTVSAVAISPGATREVAVPSAEEEEGADEGEHQIFLRSSGLGRLDGCALCDRGAAQAASSGARDDQGGRA